MQIEIADNRDVIWTHVPHRFWVSPAREAAWIAQSLAAGQRIYTAGSFPLPPARAHTTRSIRAVSNHLRRFNSARPLMSSTAK